MAVVPEPTSKHRIFGQAYQTFFKKTLKWKNVSALTTNRKITDLWAWYKIISFYFHVLGNKNTKQKTKIGPTINEYLNKLFGVLQDSILRPLLISMSIADLLYTNSNTEFENYADDNTLFICGQDFIIVIEVLEPNLNKFFN